MAIDSFDAVVIGGGFFGAYLSLLLAERHKKVALLERADQLMTRASYANQARVHAGYHYPRSLITAVRSRVNFPRFVEDFTESIVSDFQKYYAVSRVLSKVTAHQFATFMARVGAPLNPAPRHVTKLFNSELIEAVFGAREVAFDSTSLRETMAKRLASKNVLVRCGVDVQSVKRHSDEVIQVLTQARDGQEEITANWVFNCTYSAINEVRARSGLSLIPLKNELAEMALVTPPPALRGISVTVMCGPFFSLMPFPTLKQWTLSHVRYTPHSSWSEGGGHIGRKPVLSLYPPSNAQFMISDSARYLPAIRDCRVEGSLWEVKTVLPQSENDDSRPILFHRDSEIPRFISVLGGKLDNVYDIPTELDQLWEPPLPPIK